MAQKQKKFLVYLIYSLTVVFIFGFLLWLGHFRAFQDFMNKIENSSYDLRQSIISTYKKQNKNIVILAIDDESYEYIMDKFGSWPVSRKIWAEVIETLEKAQSKYIVFDLLFLKPNLADIESDFALIKAVENRDNIFFSMNFDNYNEAVRTPKILDNKLKLKVDKGFLSDNQYITFTNVRPLMDDLEKAAGQVGSINVVRDEDGIIRTTIPVFKYRKEYYPNLSLALALNMLDKKSISIKKNTIIIDKKHKIPLDKTNRAIINWYGKKGTYKNIPLWEVIEKKDDIGFLQNNFEDKIVYIGTTATSLADIKSTPLEPHLSGVELHGNFLNNILDNNFIKRLPLKIDFLISIILSFIIGYFVLRTDSVLKTFIVLFATLVLYALISTYALLFFKIWMSVVFPYITMFCTFILVYCEKYLLKVKDYEQTYKLAITDGLTQLYNHRYFQEQMILNVNNYLRYNTTFSLILIDIDFFKKFNDTYGHQSGDFVLRKTAQILKKNSRALDIVCRYGGEEMAIILTNTNNKDAISAANKICEAVRNADYNLVDDQKAKVTISLGVATIGLNGASVQELIEYCDKCLYKAKELGRNRVESQL